MHAPAQTFTVSLSETATPTLAFPCNRKAAPKSSITAAPKTTNFIAFLL
jgi:hypothetical protein